LKKHVDAHHVVLAKKFEEEVNPPLRNVFEKQLEKNRLTLKYKKKIGAKDPFKKDVVQQTQNLQGLTFLVVKDHLPIQFDESTWLKHLVMHLCPRIVFPSKKTFSQEILVDLVEKMKQEYMLLKLKQCYYVIASFDLWMSRVHMMFLYW
jgi:hypothetical protein